MELSKIIRDEIWLKAEKQGQPIPEWDQETYDRAIKIWRELNEQSKKEDSKFLLGEEY